MNISRDALTTARLTVRPFRPEDGADLYAYLNEPGVLQYETMDAPGREEADAIAAKRAENVAFWAVNLNGQVIGNLYFSPGEFDTCELGYVFGSRWWGQSYAYEAARALLSAAFTRWGVRRVTAMCNPENHRSWHLMERMGMRREAHFIKDIWFHKNAAGEPLWQDTYAYGILAQEWKG